MKVHLINHKFDYNLLMFFIIVGNLIYYHLCKWLKINLQKLSILQMEQFNFKFYKKVEFVVINSFI